jgi:hypothetical protein
MAAIAESDDLHAWLIRGLVEAGLPDHTRGGATWTAEGALNLENYIQDQGVGGILLQFLGQMGDLPQPDDEYTYQVAVVRGAAGTGVRVVCVDTLFDHTFPDEPKEELAAHILAQLRAHNDAFTAWRKKGGETTYAQRAAIPAAGGTPCDRGLVTVLETLRRANRSVVEGPANNWWVTGKATVGPPRIVAGLGQEPQYITRKRSPGALSPEDIVLAGRLRTAGTAMLVASGVGISFAGLGTLVAAWDIWHAGNFFAGLRGLGWGWLSLFGAMGFAVLYLVAGLRLRALRSRTLVGVLALLGMFPCFTPCCGVGVPMGAWVLYLLYDARSSKVFGV